MTNSMIHLDGEKYGTISLCQNANGVHALHFEDTTGNVQIVFIDVTGLAIARRVITWEVRRVKSGGYSGRVSRI